MAANSHFHIPIIVVFFALALLATWAYTYASSSSEGFECWCRQGTPVMPTSVITTPAMATPATPTALIPTAAGVVALPLPPAFTNQMLKNGIGTRVMDCDGGACSKGDKVQIWQQNGGAGQKWTYDPVKQSLTSGGQCLDVPGSGTANGQALQSYDCNGTSAQQWKWQKNMGTAPGAYQLVNLNSGKCLDVAGGSAADNDGVPLQLWDCPTSATGWNV